MDRGGEEAAAGPVSVPRMGPSDERRMGNDPPGRTAATPRTTPYLGGVMRLKPRSVLAWGVHDRGGPLCRAVAPHNRVCR